MRNTGKLLVRSMVCALVCSGIALEARATEYFCQATLKANVSRGALPAAALRKQKFAFRLEDNKGSAALSRCALEVASNKMHCDRQEVDRIDMDDSERVKKYYVFSQMVSFQILADLSAVHDNGKGDLTFARCEITSP